MIFETQVSKCFIQHNAILVNLNNKCDITGLNQNRNLSGCGFQAEIGNINIIDNGYLVNHVVYQGTIVVFVPKP